MSNHHAGLALLIAPAVALWTSTPVGAGEAPPSDFEFSLTIAQCSDGDPRPGLTFMLDAGSWAIAPILTLGNGVSAWNSSGQVSACEFDGSNCATGWITDFSIVFGTSYGHDRTTKPWATPLLAYVNAPTTTFSLAQSTEVTFWISDPNCADNEGEIHLHIYPIDGPLSADVNTDDAVDGADLGAILEWWGSSHPICDLDGDGIVGGGDLAVVFEGWSDRRS